MNTVNKRNKLVVLSVDALVCEDLKLAGRLPGFGRVMKQNCMVEKVLSVFPTLTYPVHVVQATGRNIMNTGVYNNEAFQPGRMEPDWCWDAAYIKVPTIFDAARAAGLTTCAIMWPVLAKAKIDFNIPEVWDMDNWDDPRPIYQEYSSPEGYKYFLRHLDKLGWHSKPEYDEFAISAAEDILRNEMPDISFIHVSAVDIARHYNGVYCGAVDEAIKTVDRWISRLFAAIDAAGYGNDTNFIICSDHGHLTVKKELNLNVLFCNNGLITLDECENVKDYEAWCHSASLSAQIMLKDNTNESVRKKVVDILDSVKNQPEYGVREIYTKAQAEKMFKLSGPFEYVLEGEDGTVFGHAYTGRVLKGVSDSDYTYVTAAHGHQPEIGPQPVFLASGPDFKYNAVLHKCSILDELPTYLNILNLRMEDLEGQPLRELLN